MRLIPYIDLEDEKPKRIGILYLEQMIDNQDNEDIVYKYIKKVKGLFTNITCNILAIPAIQDISIGIRKLTEEFIGLEAIVILGYVKDDNRELNNFIYLYNSKNDTFIINSLYFSSYGSKEKFSDEFIEKQIVRLNHLLNLKISKNL